MIGVAPLGAVRHRFYLILTVLIIYYLLEDIYYSNIICNLQLKTATSRERMMAMHVYGDQVITGKKYDPDYLSERRGSIPTSSPHRGGLE